MAIVIIFILVAFLATWAFLWVYRVKKDDFLRKKAEEKSKAVIIARRKEIGSRWAHHTQEELQKHKKYRFLFKDKENYENSWEEARVDKEVSQLGIIPPFCNRGYIFDIVTTPENKQRYLDRYQIVDYKTCKYVNLFDDDEDE